MPKKHIVPEQDRVLYDEWHFSPAVRVGDTVYCSGQVGVNAALEPADGITAQTRLAFENLKRVLAEEDLSLKDVVEITTFHTNLQGDLGGFAAVKDEFLPADFPAWTAIGVSELALPGLEIEIRATAVAGAG